LREAKLVTDWTAPDATYEEAARALLFALMDDRGFRAAAAALVRRIGPAGAVNGLAQAILKSTVPGVPDFYQGTEFWDCSLVDPDNRRPVDFPARVSALRESAAPADLLGHWRDGRVKQAVIARVLAMRRNDPALFARGSYQRIEAVGPRARHVVAFARAWEERAVLVVVPRLALSLLGEAALPLVPADAWQGTTLCLPSALAGRRLVSVLNENETESGETMMPVADILRRLPVNVLYG
jgi:(1->4)-alpha-D-glucan 1-alpha-D-glucosylmutase